MLAFASSVSRVLFYYQKLLKNEEFLKTLVGKLAFTRLNLITTKVLLSLSVKSMLTSDRIILLEADLLGRVLNVLCCVISSVTAQGTHKTYQFTLRILLCHWLLTYVCYFNLTYFSIKSILLLEVGH